MRDTAPISIQLNPYRFCPACVQAETEFLICRQDFLNKPPSLCRSYQMLEIRHLSKSMGQFSKTNPSLLPTLIAMNRNSSDLTSPVVLLVDDVQTVELYSGAFRQSYRVLTSSDLNDAEQILTRENPEIAIVEPSIGGEQGWDWVKSMIQTYAIPTVICSALDERKMGLNAGVSAYLIKPVPPAILAQTIASLLNKVP